MKHVKIHFTCYLSLREKRVLKQYPWGTIATNGPLFSKGQSFFLNNHVSVPLCRWGTKTVPLEGPNYGQANSTPRGTIRYPFFLSAGLHVFP